MPKHIESMLSPATSWTRKRTSYLTHFSPFVSTWLLILWCPVLEESFRNAWKGSLSVRKCVAGSSWDQFGAVEAELGGRGALQSSIISGIYLQTWPITKLSMKLFGFISMTPQTLPLNPGKVSLCNKICNKIFSKWPTISFTPTHWPAHSNLPVTRAGRAISLFREEEIKAQEN